MINWTTCLAVERDQARMSGAWTFKGTRVPVASLFENLEDGITIGEYLELFEGVGAEQVKVVLEHTARSLEIA